ncbi:hypothetical protein D3C71_1773070 [compost metagenome]
MPVVTPAEVQSCCCCTKMASASRSTLGNSWWKRSRIAQWVVARLPSSRPAKPSRKAPVHTDATRRTLAGASCSQAISVAECWATSMIFGEPGTTTVSTRRRSNVSSDSTCIIVPSAEGTAPPATLAVWQR